MITQADIDHFAEPPIDEPQLDPAAAGERQRCKSIIEDTLVGVWALWPISRETERVMDLLRAIRREIIEGKRP